MYQRFQNIAGKAERDLQLASGAASMASGIPSQWHGRAGPKSDVPDISVRYAKKLIFVFLSQRAPVLYQELLQQRKEQQKAHDSTTAVGSVSPSKLWLAKTTSSLDVLNVTLELDVPPAARSAFAATASERSVSDARHQPSSDSLSASSTPINNQHCRADASDLPPRYQRLNKEKARRVQQQSVEGRRQRWGIQIPYDQEEHQRRLGEQRQQHAVADNGGGFFSRQQRQAKALEQGEPSVIWTVAEEEWEQLQASRLLAKPPLVTAYRLVGLSECPQDVQRRAEGHDESSSFLVWASVYVNNTVLLMSDAIVLMKLPQQQQQSPSYDTSFLSPPITGTTRIGTARVAAALSNLNTAALAAANTPANGDPATLRTPSPPRGKELVDLIASGKLATRRLTETVVSDKMIEAKVPTTMELQGLPTPGDTLENKDIQSRVASWLRLSVFSSLVSGPPPAAAAQVGTPERLGAHEAVEVANAQAALASPSNPNGRAPSPPRIVRVEAHSALQASTGSSVYGTTALAGPGAWPPGSRGLSTDDLPQLVAEQLGRNIKQDPFSRQRVVQWEKMKQQQIRRELDAAADRPATFSGQSPSGEGRRSGTGTGFRQHHSSNTAVPEMALFLSAGARPSFPLREAADGEDASPRSKPFSGDVLARNFQDRLYMHETGPVSVENFNDAKLLLMETHDQLNTLSTMAASLNTEVGRHQQLLEGLQFESQQRPRGTAEALAAVQERVEWAARRLEKVQLQTEELIAQRGRKVKK